MGESTMNALRPNLLPTLALNNAQYKHICQVNRDLHMERTYEVRLIKIPPADTIGIGYLDSIAGKTSNHTDTTWKKCQPGNS
jgi:hypothetical protein